MFHADSLCCLQYAERYQAQAVTNISVKSGTIVSQDFVLISAPGSVKILVTNTEGVPISDAEVFLDSESVGPLIKLEAWSSEKYLLEVISSKL
ncbi:MAG: hypothetical protein HXS48_13540 [Theionarchaea archaeon]|nr:hypothetical protein [Theionarchaea archaeon]